MLFANRLVVSKISISPSSKSISILQKVSKLLVTRLAILNVGRFSFKSSSTCSIPIPPNFNSVLLQIGQFF